MALPLDLVVFGADRVCGRGADRAAGFLVVGAERVAWGRLGAVRAGVDRVVDREGATLRLGVERVCGDRLGVARLVDGAR